MGPRWSRRFIPTRRRSTCRSATTATTCRRRRCGTTTSPTTAGARAGRGPAWRATGQPEGPKYKNKSTGMANLAGRASAAMALAGDVETAAVAVRPGPATPRRRDVGARRGALLLRREHAIYDDMEWAATELYIATKDPQYLDEAVEYARPGRRRTRGWASDRHGHYEFFPYVNLAHWRLYPHVERRTTGEARPSTTAAGSSGCAMRAEKNPYRLGTPLVWCSTNDVIALATQAVLYEQMTGDKTYRALAAEARDWIFGRNPWGVSLVDRRAGGRPRRQPAASPVLQAWPSILPVGGLVDGPVYKDINDSLKFEPFGDDAYARFQSDVGVYHDCYADFSTNEPIIDGTVSLLLLTSFGDKRPGGATGWSGRRRNGTH